MLCLKYEELVVDPARQMRDVLSFLGLDYEPDVVHGSGNRTGIPEFEMAYKWRCIEPITALRIGNWRLELSPAQIDRLERLGGGPSAPSATTWPLRRIAGRAPGKSLRSPFGSQHGLRRSLPGSWSMNGLAPISTTRTKGSSNRGVTRIRASRDARDS